MFTVVWTRFLEDFFGFMHLRQTETPTSWRSITLSLSVLKKVTNAARNIFRDICWFYV